MGSDSRTATAKSTKPRPKWRDRHLSQLNNDQLEEVEAYRGDIVAVVGVESSVNAYPDEKPVVRDDMPQRQAGPDRARRAQVDDRHHRREPERKPTQEFDYRRDDRPDARRERYEHDRRESPARREEGRSDQRDNRSQRMEQESRRHPPREQDRAGSGRRDDYENRQRSAGQQQYSSREQERYHEASYNGDRKQAGKKVDDREGRKGAFAKLLSFKLEGPLKYGLIVLAVVAMITVSFMKPIDHSSQSQLDSALTRAMIGFGLARTLNGVISVAQGTEFAVQPAGVGVNFSPGEILDPINDLVERFSWVMLLATSSLGIQKILLEVSSWAGISMLLAGAGLFFLLTRIRNSAVSSMADVAGKLLLLMLLVRFLIPLGSLANDWVYRQFLQPHFEQSSQQLEIASERIRDISTRQTAAEKPSGSLKERAKNLYNSMTSKFDFDGMLNDYKNSAENVSEHAVNLIVVFLLQTIVFPLMFLYLIYRLFRSLLLPRRHYA